MIRRRRAHERSAPGKQISDFTGRERIAFRWMWSPGRWASVTRWLTWDEYLADYAEIRTELLNLRADGRPPFAERVLRFRELHGAEALERADYGVIREIDAPVLATKRPRR